MFKIPNFDSNNMNSSEPAVSTGSATLDSKTLSDILRKTWIEEKRLSLTMSTGKPSFYRPGPALDGGIDAAGKNHKPVWPKLATFVTKASVNPMLFVRAQFYLNMRPPMSPNMIMNDVAISRYRDYLSYEKDFQSLKVAKDCQIRAAHDAIELNKKIYGPNSIDVYRDIILDPNISISALFRYMLALECGDQKLAKQWFDEAYKQYIYNKQGYDSVWNDLIPKELKGP